MEELGWVLIKLRAESLASYNSNLSKNKIPEKLGRETAWELSKVWIRILQIDEWTELNQGPSPL